MIDERTMELINGEIDEVLSDSDKVDLNIILEHSLEARQYYDSLKQLDGMLSALPEQELGEELHDKIAKSIAPVTHVTPITVAASSKAASFFNYGLATAAGLLLAIGYYEFSGKDLGPMDTSQMMGTMSPDATKSAVIDEFKINEGGVSSHARLESRNDELVLDITIDSDVPTDISVNLGGNTLRFGALAQLQNQLESIQIDGQLIQVRSQGRQRFAVLLQRKDGEEFGDKDVVELDYLRDGTLIQHGTLSPD